MREHETFPEILQQLLTCQTLAVLASTGVHCPYASLIAFCASTDLRRLYFATLRSTRKSDNLHRHSQVSLLVDDRHNRPDDFAQASAVTVRGRAVRLTGEERSRAEGMYLHRFPHLDDFVRSPLCDLYELRVEQFVLVTRFQQVTEYRLEPDHDPHH